MKLVDAARELDPIERSHFSSIMITAADGGYRARFVIHISMPHAESPKLPKGVSVSGIEHLPDIERVIDWRIPAWEQVLEVVNDPILSLPSELGKMQAVENSAVSEDGDVATSDSKKHWVIVTHGSPHSAERKEWLARIMNSAYSSGIAGILAPGTTRARSLCVSNG